MIASILAMTLAAQAQPETPPIVVEGQKPAEDRKVCRNMRETGTHVVRQVCRTPAEQKQLNTRASNTLKMGNRSPDPPDAFVPPPPE
jgi:hypothetical protein